MKSIEGETMSEIVMRCGRDDYIHFESSCFFFKSGYDYLLAFTSQKCNIPKQYRVFQIKERKSLFKTSKNI